MPESMGAEELLATDAYCKEIVEKSEQSGARTDVGLLLLAKFKVPGLIARVRELETDNARLDELWAETTQRYVELYTTKDPDSLLPKLREMTAEVERLRQQAGEPPRARLVGFVSAQPSCAHHFSEFHGHNAATVAFKCIKCGKEREA